MAGILIPLLCAAFPIYKSCIRSVKEGLFERTLSTATGKSKGTYFKKNPIFTSSKIIMPINNLLRKKIRTILAVLALLTGGVLYMTSQNIITSIDKTVDASMKDFRWDYNITLVGNYQEERLKEVVGTIDGLDRYEIWGRNTMLFMGSDNLKSVNCPVRIIPENSQIVNSTLKQELNGTDGRNTIVVNNGLSDDEKWIKPGMTIKVESNGQTADVVISAIVNEVPALPTVYMNSSTFERLFGGKSGQMILAGANTRDINNNS